MENGGRRAGLTRRKLLAGVSLGAIGVVTGASALVDGSPPTYRKYTYAATQEDREALRVAWYEKYNGETLESQNGTPTANVSDTLDPNVLPYYVDDAPGPVIQIENVLPGDSGSLHVGLQAVADDPVTITMTGSLDTNDENGYTEPERRAGDSSEPGELGAQVQAKTWADTGINFLGGMGACNGSQEAVGERTIAEGSLEDTLSTLADGVTLVECLGTDVETFCVGFDWNLPKETGNQVQTDEVTFSVEFTPSLCEEL
jgi:hypothetical protein